MLRMEDSDSSANETSVAGSRPIFFSGSLDLMQPPFIQSEKLNLNQGIESIISFL
jgi:hypothetical protein